MSKKTTGKISKFGTKGYGFIVGDDGEEYFVHQKNISNKERMQVGTRVIFNTQTSETGLVATEVDLLKSLGAKSLSDGVIKALFAVLFITQAVIIYQVFLSK